MVYQFRKTSPAVEEQRPPQSLEDEVVTCYLFDSMTQLLDEINVFLIFFID